jgi:signal transduction histidine kinase
VTVAPLRLGILTCSDTRTEAEDTAGRALRELLEGRGWAVAAYEVVRDDQEALMRALDRLQPRVADRDHFYAVRAQDPIQLSPVEAAARFIYLNKTCYNGLYRVNRAGRFNVPIGRFATPPALYARDNLLAVSAAFARAELRCADYREALGQILCELERTSRLIEDLLTLARADSGTASLPLAPISLAECIAEACRQIEQLCSDKQVELKVSICAQPCQVEGNYEALRRLCLILFDNAIKYTGAGGRIEVLVTERDGFAVIQVTDSGIGISQEDLPNIFERFYRADKARSRASGGKGLGLSIARWIVEAHHGEIKAESTLGKGSTFRIRLPLAPA